MSSTRALAEAATGPLKGVRIVDLTTVVFGAYATQMLGDMGADVIKIEQPAASGDDAGDILRWAGDTPADGPRDLGPIFMTLNRNKRSMLLDLRQPADAEVLRKLIATADVFVTSVRYDGVSRLGLSYEQVKAIRPDIIYVHGAGYDSDGPYAGLPAYDDLVQAGCGLADLLGRTDGDPTPRYLPILLADKVSGMFMVQAVTAALFHRQRTGEGQFVEAPMYECMTSFVLAEHFFGHVYDPPTGPWSYPRVTNPERKPYQTLDGYIGLLPYTNKQWTAFFAVAGLEQAAADPRFADYQARGRHIRELYALVEQVVRGKTTDEWLALLEPRQVPVVRLNRLEDLQDDAQLRAVGLFERYEHAEAGAYTALRPPVKFSATPSNIRRHPPRLGEHTEALIAELEADGLTP